ncbi:hypothetical protein MH117_06845 [Paenibacillus sp. ACRRX]|uniref:hypothetical protein n=1 Tax=Paenibacillus sp. ACRRX TaxID=2918206 RepID=UPI001EF6D592|nr:hypothetical protein [Paenibacillus sp. ACRRX]MCG7407129.1 hypothetical protein [Paenibacillus sp. ACRRX]
MKGVVKLIGAFTTFVLVFITLGSIPVSAGIFDPPPRPVAYLCTDADYQGHCIGLVPGLIYRLDERGFNDMASSIRFESDRAQVTVFEHLAYLGRSTTYNFSDRDLSDEYIGNDTVSSVWVSAYDSNADLFGVYLYDHAGMSGDWIRLLSSANTIQLNDKVSSIRIVGAYDITIYEHADFTGRSLSFRGTANYPGVEISDLVPYGFNDITSSIIITKL